MKHISTFSGGGGFDLAAEWSGWDNLASCEIEDFQNKILNYYWPEAYHHRDIKTLTWKIIEHEARKRYGNDWQKDGVILTGGFPCQPFSQAGKRGGSTDDRYLWPEMFRIIKEGHPDWVVAENVAGITPMAFPGKISTMGGQSDIFGKTDEIHELRQEYILNHIINDFESEGYEVQPFIIPACAMGAPHRRDRIWIVANRDNGNRQEIGLQAGGEINLDGAEGERVITNLSNSGAKNLQQEWANGIYGFKPIANANKFDGNISGLCSSEIPQQQPSGIRGNITSNPGSQQLQNRTPERNEPDREEEKTWLDNRTERSGDFADAANTIDQGLRGSQRRQSYGQRDREETFRPTTQRFKIQSWSDWPTQPPVCSGNDGISERLDGITFSKWRQESIKTFGNAIVPQVAFEIFQGINEVNKVFNQ